MHCISWLYFQQDSCIAFIQLHALNMAVVSCFNLFENTNFDMQSSSQLKVKKGNTLNRNIHTPTHPISFTE